MRDMEMPEILKYLNDNIPWLIARCRENKCYKNEGKSPIFLTPPFTRQLADGHAIQGWRRAKEAATLLHYAGYTENICQEGARCTQPNDE